MSNLWTVVKRAAKRPCSAAPPHCPCRSTSSKVSWQPATISSSSRHPPLVLKPQPSALQPPSSTDQVPTPVKSKPSAIVPSSSVSYDSSALRLSYLEAAVSSSKAKPLLVVSSSDVSVSS